MERVLEAARSQRLVIFAGAGISMIPPTALPSWTALDCEVVQSLAGELEGNLGPEELPFLPEILELLLASLRSHRLPPEYMAELLFQHFGHKFGVPSPILP